MTFMPLNRRIIIMKAQKVRLHLEIQTSSKNPVGIIRSSHYENGKTKHTQHGRITGKTLEQLKLLQLAFREEVMPMDSPQAFKILQNKEYGASYAIREVITQIGLDKVLFSRSEPWVKSIIAMIIGRIIYAGSKLSLCNQQDNTSLWELCGLEGKLDVDKHCYQPLDELLKRQKAIQKKLAQKYLAGGNQLVLYDLTSSYLEGEYAQSEIVNFGYNKDGKRGYEQIVIGLICSPNGCPIGIEVYEGNTKDSVTVIDKVHEIREEYGIEKVIFVGDRGTFTNHNMEALKDEKNLYFIGALTRDDIKHLLSRNNIQIGLFDDTNVIEVQDSQDLSKRYCLCRNPERAKRDLATRMRLLELTKDQLTQIAHYKQATTVELLGARIGKVFSKYKTGKYITWEVKGDSNAEKSRNHEVIWKVKDEVVEHDGNLDGCYIITTNLPKEEMDALTVVKSYKKLILVEKAFKNLKTVQLEVRPIYHRKDDRIKAHVFMCMLAYYVQWHIQGTIITIGKRPG